MKQTALELFDKPKAIIRKHYLDLSINERINVKANSCGFQIIFLKHSILCFRNYHGFIRHDDHPEKLSERWFLHHKINKNRNHIVKSTLF